MSHINDIFTSHNFELTGEELQKFEKFLEIFMETNSQINLSAIRHADGIIEKHFADSLYLAAFYDVQGKIADLWTWGGFPGIPLAITHPNAQFTLIDSVGKKLKCIENFANALDLQNVTTKNGRAEDIWKDLEHREQYDMVVSRATAFLPTLIEYALPLLKVWGMLAAYKLTDKKELTSSKKALARLWAKIYKIKNYKIDEQERSIIFIEKIAPTHKKYPRKVWIPLKEPIV